MINKQIIRFQNLQQVFFFFGPIMTSSWLQASRELCCYYLIRALGQSTTEGQKSNIQVVQPPGLKEKHPRADGAALSVLRYHMATSWASLFPGAATCGSVQTEQRSSSMQSGSLIAGTYICFLLVVPSSIFLSQCFHCDEWQDVIMLWLRAVSEPAMD